MPRRPGLVVVAAAVLASACDVGARWAEPPAPIDEAVSCAVERTCGACVGGNTCGGGGVVGRCGARACTRFVAPDADPARALSACDHPATPCALATANRDARAGDVLCLAGGDYRTAIAPKASGAEGAPIVYQAHGGRPRIVGVGVGLRLERVGFVEIDGVRVEGGRGRDRVVRFFELTAAHDSWIRNASFRRADAYFGALIDAASRRNRVTGSVFEDAPHLTIAGPASDGETWPADMLYLEGDQTLLADNDFGLSSHYAVSMRVWRGHRTVIRGNRFGNRLHAGLNLLSWEGDDGRVLVEGNRFVDQGSWYHANPNVYSRTRRSSRDDGDPQGRQVAVQLAADGALIRRNELTGNGRGLWISGWFTPPSLVYPRNARVGHNTFDGNLTHLSMANDTAQPFVDVKIADNLFHAPRLRDVHADHVTVGPMDVRRNGWTTDARFRYLCGFDAERTLEDVQRAYPEDWADNLALDPRAEGAPAIDAAGWPTTIAGPGPSPTSIVVADPWWFYDGWGLPGERGDLVATSRGDVARVVAVDLAAGVVELDREIEWSVGDGLGPPYGGEAPDLGAHEECDEER